MPQTQQYCIEPISAFNDNYIWCIHNKTHALVVDPGDASVVAQYLQTHALTLSAILITHSHADHIGGVAELCRQYSAATVYSNLTQLTTQKVQHGSIINIHQIAQLSFEVIAVPGHTLNHLVFYSRRDNLLFSGDTLFSAGCGRIFEGSYRQMYDSLMRLAALPGNTFNYPAHEYTLKNLEFALSVDKNNQFLKQYYQFCSWLRAHNLPTVPTTLAIEQQINPFLRCANQEFRLQHNISLALDLFTQLRQLRNSFV